MGHREFRLEDFVKKQKTRREMSGTVGRGTLSVRRRAILQRVYVSILLTLHALRTTNLGGTLKVVVILIPIFIIAASGSGFSQFEHLKEPRISTRKDQKMLVVKAKGDPNLIGGQAFGLLFQVYLKIQKTAKNNPMSTPPRARWPISLDTPKSEWIGLYGLAVPDGTKDLSQYEAKSKLNVSLTTWEYGEVAEIRHVGPYDEEEPTLRRLVDFIHEKGYETVGGHEEEYIIGPPMNSRGDPEKYVTILRYRIKKQASTSN